MRVKLIPPADSEDILIVGVVTRGHKFAVYCRPSQRQLALNVVADWARRKALPEFTWVDALVLQRRIREACQ